MGQPKLRADKAPAPPSSPAPSAAATVPGAWQKPAGLTKVGWAIVGAVVLIVNLPLIHYALRSAPEAGVALPYEDRFDSPSTVKEHYFTTGGFWRVVNGELFSPGVRNNPLWLKAKLPQNVRVEFDVRSASPEGDIRVEIFGNGVDHLSGYELVHGGWNNSLSVIARLDENGRPLSQLRTDAAEVARRRGLVNAGPVETGVFHEKTRARVDSRALPVRSGKTYRWRIERRGTLLRWSIDGQPFLEFDDPLPLKGNGHDRFGFSSLESDLYYDNLKVQPLEDGALFPTATATPPPPPAEPAGPFADNFDRASLGAEWLVTDPSAAGIDHGALTLRNGHNHPVWLTKPIPTNAVIEFDCWSASPDGDLKVEAWGDGHSFYAGNKQGAYTSSGYVFIFGGWNNTASALAKQHEHGDARAVRTDVRVEPHRHYHWRITRQGGEISWMIDGKPFLTFKDPAPLQGSEHQYFAFSNWEAPVYFDNLRIQPL
jgi:hypothetical protein